MSYVYAAERASVFTEDGRTLLARIRANAQKQISESGAAHLHSMISGLSGQASTILACIDYMVEIGELKEVTPPSEVGQDRVFVAGDGPASRTSSSSI